MTRPTPNFCALVLLAAAFGPSPAFSFYTQPGGTLVKEVSNNNFKQNFNIDHTSYDEPMRAGIEARSGREYVGGSAEEFLKEISDIGIPGSEYDLEPETRRQEGGFGDAEDQGRYFEGSQYGYQKPASQGGQKKVHRDQSEGVPRGLSQYANQRPGQYSESTPGHYSDHQAGRYFNNDRPGHFSDYRPGHFPNYGPGHFANDRPGHYQAEDFDRPQQQGFYYDKGYQTPDWFNYEITEVIPGDTKQQRPKQKVVPFPPCFHGPGIVGGSPKPAGDSPYKPSFFRRPFGFGGPGGKRPPKSYTFSQTRFRSPENPRRERDPPHRDDPFTAIEKEVKAGVPTYRAIERDVADEIARQEFEGERMASRHEFDRKASLDRFNQS